MRKQIWQSLCLSVVVAVSMVGCGSIDVQQGKQAKADFTVDTAHSVSPYFKLDNTGTGAAENLTVVENKTLEQVTVLAIVKPDGTTMPAADTVTLPTGQGVQVQMRSAEVRDYRVQWTESGHSFEKMFQLPPLQKIETH